jgi:hypothetical protein
MNKIITVALSTLLIFVLSASAFCQNFNGASDWALVELERAHTDGFITDKIAQDFGQNITREEFCEIAVILYDRLGGDQNLETYNPFTDTTNPQVIKAFNAGIINGVGGPLFAPDANLTREQLCAMIVRAMKSAGIIFGEENQYAFQKDYADMDDVSNWSYASVMIMNDFKIMNGSGNKLEPRKSISREQAVIMLERTFLREFEIEDNVLVAYLGNSEQVTVPSGVVKISEDVFHKNNFIESVSLPLSIEEIGYASFREMTQLTSIGLNEGLEVIGEASFELCENLQNVTLPSSLKKIDFMAFQDCISLTEITLPQNLNYIEDQSFYRCVGLTKVIFEGDVDYIGDSAFDECPNLVFVCQAGSNAEAYALDHGIQVIHK